MNVIGVMEARASSPIVSRLPASAHHFTMITREDIDAMRRSTAALSAGLIFDKDRRFC
jgi:hypothetical protein